MKTILIFCFKCLLHNISISQAAFPKSFALSKYFGSIWIHKEWLLRHWQRHLLCSMLHPKATCVFIDNVRHSHVRMDPLWDFLKLYLNKFFLPSTFDGFSNQKITWFFWVPINLTPSMSVFHLPFCFDLHCCYFFPLASFRLLYFPDSLAVAQPLLSSSLRLTSALDQNSGEGGSLLLLLSQSILDFWHCSGAKNKTKIGNFQTWQLKLWSPFTRFINSIRRVIRIKPPKILPSEQNSEPILRSQTR